MDLTEHIKAEIRASVPEETWNCLDKYRPPIRSKEEEERRARRIKSLQKYQRKMFQICKKHRECDWYIDNRTGYWVLKIFSGIEDPYRKILLVVHRAARGIDVVEPEWWRKVQAKEGDNNA